ncbi:response regulator [Paenibacillus phoenicis]|uniref:Response regulator n=1 Tax=Paenibacillus phoenicis TaxID=554117 RepID=A0ABU5PP83_9BACL|nr:MULTISPECIES: response regulator [Paenibacillus]EES74387.1 response regulator receiver domain protein [Paenibacillus sp. oral taxon 786 str. D14]MCT2196991.1 response regulator [Paenibacillus sp. p3-SID1389]MEA3571735.1 response regulator [Paenibacillus phoenicis]
MYNLLIVDDEAETREALSSYFPWNEVGFQVVGQANNGQEALRLIAEGERVDIVLTDIKMPVMSGIELAEQLYNHRRQIKVVFLSGYRDFEYAQQALHFRVINYILKPAKYHVLLDVFGKIKEELEAEAAAENQDLGPNPSAPGQGGESLIIQKIKEYVKANYKNASLEEVARLVHMNANYLSFFFKQKTGQNFSDYVLQTKMEMAAALLRDVSYKTYEISEKVGYSNAKNFTRTFKSYYGQTPSEFRNGPSSP